MAGEAPKTGVGPGPKWSDVRKLWRRWTKMVGLFATHEQGRLGLVNPAYESLHANLLLACRSLNAGADEANRRRLETMVDLAKPWLTVSCLDHADREILGDLWRRSLQLDWEINGPDRRTFWRAVRIGVIWVLAGLVLTALIMLTADTVWDPLLQSLDNLWRKARLAWKRSTAVAWWQGIGITCLGIAIIVLVRSVRR